MANLVTALTPGWALRRRAWRGRRRSAVGQAGLRVARAAGWLAPRSTDEAKNAGAQAARHHVSDVSGAAFRSIARKRTRRAIWHCAALRDTKLHTARRFSATPAMAGDGGRTSTPRLPRQRLPRAGHGDVAQSAGGSATRGAATTNRTAKHGTDKRRHGRTGKHQQAASTRNVNTQHQTRNINTQYQYATSTSKHRRALQLRRPDGAAAFNRTRAVAAGSSRGAASCKGLLPLGDDAVQGSRRVTGDWVCVSFPAHFFTLRTLVLFCVPLSIC